MRDKEKNASDNADTPNTQIFNTIIIPQTKDKDNIEYIKDNIDKLEKLLNAYDDETHELVNYKLFNETKMIDSQENEELKHLDSIADSITKLDYKYEKKAIKQTYSGYRRLLTNNITKLKSDRKKTRSRIEQELKTYKKQLSDLLDEKKVAREKKKEIERVAQSLRWKSKFFSFVIYPESMPDDAFSRLEFTGIPFAISPIHDKDIEKVTGKRKKGHYHIMGVMNDVMKGGTIYKLLVETLGKDCVNTVVEVKDFEGSYKYLTHDTEKAISDGKYKYNKDDIIHLNGFNVNYSSYKREFDDGSIQVVITNYIVDNQIQTMSDLIGRLFFKNAMDLDKIGITKTELMDLIKKHSTVWTSIMNSYYYTELEDVKRRNVFLEDYMESLKKDKESLNATITGFKKSNIELQNRISELEAELIKIKDTSD